MLNKCTLIQAAQEAGEWLIRTQITDEKDANCGRSLHCYNLQTGYRELSTGWQVGMNAIVMAWLSLVDNRDRYLQVAERAARYVLSLQVTETHDPKQFGAFREETPQTPWLHPRDGIGSAWAMLAMFTATGEREYLRASKRYADWHLANAWSRGWPKATVQLGLRGRLENTGQFSCQAGSALFFMQLARETGSTQYIDQAARPLLDYYLDHFLEPSGQPHIMYDPVADNWDIERPVPADPGKGEREGIPASWMEMHRYNDDFAALALLQGYLDLKDPRYLHGAQAYADWLAARQLPNGGFGVPEVEVGSSCVPLFLLDLKKATGTAKYDAIIERSLTHLLTLQVHSPDPLANGGFLCLGNLCQSEPGCWVNGRNTCYSIAAILKATDHPGPALRVDEKKTAGIKTVGLEFVR